MKYSHHPNRQTTFNMCSKCGEHIWNHQRKTILFSDAPLLLWLAPLRLCRGLNPLTRLESTLTGIIEGLSRALPGTDWLNGGDGCYLVQHASVGHLNNINVSGSAKRGSALWTMNDGLLTNRYVPWQMCILWHFAVAPISRQDKFSRCVCVWWQWCMNIE